MKVIKRPAALVPKFIPVTFEITIENEEEMTDWYRLTTNNLSIPAFFRKEGRISPDDEKRLTLFMSKLCYPESSE